MNGKTSATYGYSIEIIRFTSQVHQTFSSLSTGVRDIVFSNDRNEKQEFKKNILNNLEMLQKEMSNFSAYLKSSDLDNSFELESEMDKLAGSMTQLASVVNNLAELGESNQTSKLIKSLKADFTPLSANLYSKMQEVIDNVTEQMQESDQSNQSFSRAAAYTMILILLCSLVIVVFLCFFIISKVSSPIQAMLEAAIEISEGNLDVEIIPQSNDEIGQLAEKFSVLAATLRSLISDLSKLSREHEEGNIDARIHSEAYKGSYANLADGLNEMVGSYTTLLSDLFNCIESMSQGNFNAAVPSLKGKKAVYNQGIEGLKANLKSISKDIMTLAESASKGNLAVLENDSKYRGDWAKVLELLNSMMKSVAMPIEDTVSMNERMAAGDFSKRVEADYSGEFGKIKEASNLACYNISAYIQEIAAVLEEMSLNNLDQQITQEYVGDFKKIKDAFNHIFQNLSSVMIDINKAADQVSTGARQISDSSINLAEGSSSQAAAIEELIATVAVVNEKTIDNAKNAKQAELLSLESRKHAEEGNDEMKQMVSAMESIKDASGNISKIIKVIDDIAFQTNLLALNAAVEAARAGEHGKGFAVVASEVRNLAARSMRAAQETTSLIEDTVNKVNLGMGIADKTATSLNTIVNAVTDVSSLISSISAASADQSESIGQISEGTNQISVVVEQNSSTSEETAAAAQELSSQSEILRSMIGSFKLLGSEGDNRTFGKIPLLSEKTSSGGAFPAKYSSASRNDSAYKNSLADKRESPAKSGSSSLSSSYPIAASSGMQASHSNVMEFKNDSIKHGTPTSSSSRTAKIMALKSFKEEKKIETPAAGASSLKAGFESAKDFGKY
jgi:methyl-accepting chemotaxis protein